MSMQLQYARARHYAPTHLALAYPTIAGLTCLTRRPLTAAPYAPLPVQRPTDALLQPCHPALPPLHSEQVTT